MLLLLKAADPDMYGGRIYALFLKSIAPVAHEESH